MTMTQETLQKMLRGTTQNPVPSAPTPNAPDGRRSCLLQDLLTYLNQVGSEVGVLADIVGGMTDRVLGPQPTNDADAQPLKAHGLSTEIDLARARVRHELSRLRKQVSRLEAIG